MQSVETKTKQLEDTRERLSHSLALLRSPPQPIQDVDSRVAVGPEPTSPINSAFLEQLLPIMVTKLEGLLSEEECRWFGSSLLGIPGFLSSASGQSVVRLVFDEYRKWMVK